MLLLPILQELWFSLLLVLLGWLVAPIVLIWFGKYRIAIAVTVWWAVMFGLMGYFALQTATKPYHPNRDMPLVSSLSFLMAVVSSLASLGLAAVIAIFAWRLSKFLPVSTLDLGTV